MLLIPLAVPVIAFGMFITVIAALFGGGESSSTSSGKLGNTLAYVSPITTQASAHGVPSLWAIADVAWESSGNWLATNDNTNGTTDAGLGQLNSANWDAYGMSDNPYDVTKNLAACETILGNAYRTYGNMDDALYAYNGGSPMNGRLYNPGYAPNVTGLYQFLKSAPLLVEVQSYSGNTVNLTAGEAQFTTYSETVTTIGADGKPTTTTRTWQEQTGEINPGSLSIALSSANGSVGPITVTPQSGEGLGLAPESIVYSVTFPIGLKQGDQLQIASSGGYSINVKLGKPNS